MPLAVLVWSCCCYCALCQETRTLAALAPDGGWPAGKGAAPDAARQPLMPLASALPSPPFYVPPPPDALRSGGATYGSTAQHGTQAL